MTTADPDTPAVFRDPQAMAEVAQLFRRALARCGPDCDLHHPQPETADSSKAAS